MGSSEKWTEGQIRQEFPQLNFLERGIILGEKEVTTDEDDDIVKVEIGKLPSFSLALIPEYVIRSRDWKVICRETAG